MASLEIIISRISLLIAAWIGFKALVIFYRLFFHPLAKFPGPKLAALTTWYEGYYDVYLRGQYEFKIRDLHKEYGPIIRISPNELHIHDPSFFNELYRQDGRWDKYEFSMQAFALPGAAVFTADHDIHKQRRTPLNPFLAKPAVHKRMALIQGKVDKFRALLDGYANSRSVLHLSNAYGALTIDIATVFIMGEEFDSLRHPDFNAGMTRALQGAGDLWRISKHITFVGHLMRLIPLKYIKTFVDPDLQAYLGFMEKQEIRTKEIMDNFNLEKHKLSDDPPTLVDSILAVPSLPPAEKKLQRVVNEVSTVTGAGFETTAQAMRKITYHVYADRAVLARLRAELDTLSPTADWNSTQLMQQPYLTAVLKEGLRLAPGLASRMGRLTDHPITYQGKRSSKSWTIPARTAVGMTVMAMHLDEEIFPNPERYRPERWLEGDEKHRRYLEKNFAPFSRGTRMCLGMHLAWAEMYLTIAMITSRFDLEFTGGTGPEDVEWGFDNFTVGIKGKNGIKVLVKQRQP